MTKLEQLKATIQKMFDNASDKQSIEQATQLKQSFDEVEKEFGELTNKNAELIKDYKEVIKNTSFKDKSNDGTGTNAPKVQSLEEALKEFEADEKNKKFF